MNRRQPGVALRGVWLSAEAPSSPIEDLVLVLVERSLPKAHLREAFLEELTRPAKRMETVLEHLGLREVGQEPESSPPFVFVTAKSPDHDAWRDTLLLPGGDCPIAILVNTWDRGPIAVVHEVFQSLDPVQQGLVRRHASLASRGLPSPGWEREQPEVVEEARRRVASALDPSVLLSPDGSIRVQVGSVSETTRNLLREGVRGEHVFIIPHQLFEGRTNYADIEFLIYLNFFAGHGQATRLVGTPRQRQTLERLLTIVIFGIFDPGSDGPVPLEALQTAYAVPDADTLRFLRTAHELYAVRTSTDSGSRVRTVADYLRFSELQPGGTLIPIEHQNGDGAPTQIGEVWVARGAEAYDVRITQADGAVAAKQMDVTTRRRPLRPVSDDAIRAVRFGTVRPRFGVTPLGTSHGFDPAGDVTTFVVWVNGRGIVVDPSPEGLAYLRRMGVAEADLPYVFLTHVHADHDGGLIEKILTGGRTTLIASDVVFRSFIEKARLLTGHDVQDEALVSHVPANPGEPVTIDIGGEQAELETRWNLHPIPTNGFRISVGGKVFGYAGDTQYDPALIRTLHETGRITAGQMEQLLHFFWTADGTPTVDLLYHEAGIPPIHTDRARLAELPAAVRERTYLVHVADRDVPADANPGKPVLFATEVLLAPDEALRHDVLLSTMRVVSYLYDAPMPILEKLLQHGTLREYEAGASIVTKGPRTGDTPLSFFVVIDGEVAVRDGRRLTTALQKGDTFGEWGISHQRGFRSADVAASRASQCLEFGEDGYRWLVAQASVIQDRIGVIRRLLPQLQAAQNHARLKAQRDPSARRSVIASMNASQLASFTLFSEIQSYKDGQTIIVEGEEANGFYILVSGHLLVTIGGRVIGEVPEGEIFGEVAALDGRRRTATVSVVSAEAEVLFMPMNEFRELLLKVPSFALEVRQTAAQRTGLSR